MWMKSLIFLLLSCACYKSCNLWLNNQIRYTSVYILYMYQTLTTFHSRAYDVGSFNDLNYVEQEENWKGIGDKCRRFRGLLINICKPYMK